MTCRHSPGHGAWISLLAAAISGCAARYYDTADDGYWRNDAGSMVEAYRSAVDDTGPNALLGVERLLSAALLQNDWRTAEALAVRASTLCNIFVADEGGERDAISFFGQEKDKPFKGEPHERVMVDLYLGLLRFQKQDFEGALSAFRSAMNKDRGSYWIPVERHLAKRGSDNADRYLFEDDWPLLQILCAKCHQLLDEPEEARKYFERASTTLPVMKPLFEDLLDPETNVLVIVESGRAPLKRKTGPHGAELGYVQGPRATVDGVWLGESELSTGTCEDLHYQATTVGGREVDKLNQLKAERREVLQAAGFTTAVAGYMLLAAGSGGHRRADRNIQMAGLFALAAGIAAMIIADLVIDPSADVRSWATLPGQISLAVGRAMPGGRARLLVRGRGDGQDLSQEWLDVPVEKGMNLYWTRLLPGRKGGSWEQPREDQVDGHGKAPNENEFNSN